MRSREHYIVNRMMESCSVAFHTMRHKKHSRKLMMACAKLANPGSNLETNFEDLATTCQRWFM